MKKDINPREAQYGPLQKKTFASALLRFFEQEFPQFGRITRKEIVKEVEVLVNEFFPSHTHIRMGQVMWPAVEENEHGSYGKSMENTKVKPVFLDLIHADDIEARIKGDKAKQIKINATARVFKQAKEQGGVLTAVDVATMLKLSPGTIGRYVKEWETEKGEYLPRRGVIHDLGPTLTHKKGICYSVIIEGKTIEQTARDTRHSPEAVTRYVKDYKRVSACLKKGLTAQETSYVVKVSKNLVYEYKGLIDENGDKGVCLDEMFDDHDNLPF